MPTLPSRPDANAVPKRQLTLFDSTSIIVGIIIGVGIYESTPLIALNSPGFAGLMGAWLLGGLFSLLGAMCYAELATAYPAEGGDYVYLTRAFGRPIGFLFAWAQLWVVRPGSIGAMAFIFAKYANQLWPLPIGNYRLPPPIGLEVSGEAAAMIVYAVASIGVLTAINVLGVPIGKWTQNLLTSAKVLGLLGIVAAGLTLSATPRAVAAPQAAPAIIAAPQAGGIDWQAVIGQFGFAMIFVFYAYGGWNEMAYVAAEVRNPGRNLLRSLVLGTVGVTAIYLLVTAAFVHALGMEGVRNSKAVAADVLQLGLGRWGGRVISLLICVSALGAINGLIFTGARIYYALGTEHPVFAWLGRWSPRLGTPAIALVVQSAITVPLVVGFGLTQDGFEGMVVFTSPAFWGFLLLVALSVFVLRTHDRRDRPCYRVPGYPITPILFGLSCSYMIYRSVDYALFKWGRGVIWTLALLIVGLALSCFAGREEGE